MLENTGIIRKIDELGRIVIPKELRKVLNINSGDDLEILVIDGQIVLKKYSALQNSSIDSNKIINSVSELVNSQIFISDKEKIITCGIISEKKIPNNLKEILENRKHYQSKEKESLKFDDVILEGFFFIEPIIQNSDANGLIIIFCEDEISNEDTIFAKVLKNIIENN